MKEIKEMIDELVELATYKGKREQTKKEWIKQGMLTKEEIAEFDAEIAALEAEVAKLKKEIAKEIEELEKPFKLLQQPQQQPQQKVVTQLGDTGANITIKQKNPVGHTTTL